MDNGPGLTVLRIKRKRTEDPIQSLLVAKRQNIDTSDSETDKIFTRASTIPVGQWNTTSFARKFDDDLGLNNLSLEGLPRVKTQAERARKAEDDLKPKAKRVKILDAEISGLSQDNLQSDRKLSQHEQQSLNALLKDYLMDEPGLNVQDLALTEVTEPSTDSEGEYVYDLYYKTEGVIDTAGLIARVSGLREAGEYKDLGSPEPESEEEDEDSNAEDWRGNDYPSTDEDDYD